MNLLEVFSPTEHQYLIEKLGTLVKLGMPKLLQSLKQKLYQNLKGGGNLEPMPKPGAVEYYGRNANKFARNSWDGDIGSESKIIDGGEVKKGLPDIRKGYKTNEGACAFALYLDDKPVAFARFDDYALAGASRAGMLAYDLTAFQVKIDELDKEALEKKSEWEKRNHAKSKTTTAKSIERSSYVYGAKDDEDQYKKYKEHHVGEISSTSGLIPFFELLKRLGKITVKYVMVQDFKKRRDRNANPPASERDVLKMREDLMVRLKKYKLSKKPTVDNIMEFMKAAEKGTGIIQFAGRSYSLKKTEGYEKQSPLQILQGGSFSIVYSSADPGGYESVTVSYSFDKTTSLLMPVSVTWSERGEDGSANAREEVLNRPAWLKKSGINTVSKDETIKSLLTSFKGENYKKVQQQIDTLRKEGIDYPEFKTIEKSIEAEKKKKAEKQGSTV